MMSYQTTPIAAAPDVAHHEPRAPGIDLLRALAIVTVMLYHLGSHGIALPAWVEHGWMGVDLFFVLSGYLIGWQVLRTVAQGGAPRWGRFLLDRALRILPAYYAVLILYVLLGQGREGGNLQPLWKFVTFTLNLAPDWEHGTAYSHAWSLCVEEHFYWLFPLVVWLLAGRARKRASGRLVGALALAIVAGGMLLRGALWQWRVAPHLAGGDTAAAIGAYVVSLYDPTYARLDGLLLGVMLASVRAFRPAWWTRLLRHPRRLLAAGFLVLFCCMRIDALGPIGAVVLFPLVALGCACLLAGALSPATRIGRRQLPGVRTLALLAFSLYLTHKQVYAWLDEWLPQALRAAPLAALPVYALASLAAAALLYLAVERPGLRLRARMGIKTSARGSGSATPP